MKNQKGSITLYVLVSVLFFVFILVGIYANFINKASYEEKQIEQIQSDYNQYDTEDKLDDLYSKIMTIAGGKVGDLLNEQNEVIGKKVSDGSGGEVPVPTGFYYVGGKVETGVVISDNEADKDKYVGKIDVGNNLLGNQFVWVPVDGTILEYKQDHTYDSIHSTGYTNYTDWTDEGGDSTSVAQYGGFYIGRYEAGLPTEITVGSDNTATYIGSITKNANPVTMTPVSKAGVAPWNIIRQDYSITAASKMYSGSTVVTSSLIDSYAWDTTCKWLKNSGIITENSQGKIDSTNYGNYVNSNFTVEDTLYAWHTYVTNKSTGDGVKWITASKYNKGNVTLGGYETTDTNELPADADTDTYRYYKRLEIATGSTEKTKTNNIYDLAGNVWEWTTETGYHNVESGSQFAVRRGGSFCDNGGGHPVVYRNGNYGVSHAYVNVGFRVVLYVK